MGTMDTSGLAGAEPAVALVSAPRRVHGLRGLDWHVVAGDHALLIPRPQHVGSEGLAGDAGRGFDRWAVLLGHLSAGPPVADDALAEAKLGGEGGNSAGGLDGSVEGGHTCSITYRDPFRNTVRVRRGSRSVKNGAMPFHANLRRLRTDAGLTQEGLALKLGWSQSRIANYETDPEKDSSRAPKPDEIPLIAAAIGIQAGSLFDDAPASQAMRPDPDILAGTLKVVRRAFANAGVAPDFEQESREIAEVYHLVAAVVASSPDNLVSIADQVEKRIRARAESDEQQGEDRRGGRNAVRTGGRGPG